MRRRFLPSLLGLAAPMPLAAQDALPRLTRMMVPFAPAGTPDAVIQRLNQGFRRILAEPALALRLGDLGAEPGLGPPEELAQLVRTEITRWTGVIRATNITL